MRFPVRPVRGRWPRVLERSASRFFWTDTACLLDDAIGPELFRTAMSAVHVGGTIKITGTGRHPEADGLLADLDLTGARVLDLGASDGSTSVDLVGRLAGFAEYVIADLYLTITVRRAGSLWVFYDPDDRPILVRHPLALAWPSESAALARAVAPLDRLARRRDPGGSEILLLNPAARELMARDPRVVSAVHDVFTPWTGPTLDAVKVANLLRRLYFSDDDIRRGLRAIHAGLRTGGHLLVVDNSRIRDMPSRGGLYRREEGGFTRVAVTGNVPEIDDLVGDPQLLREPRAAV